MFAYVVRARMCVYVCAVTRAAVPAEKCRENCLSEKVTGEGKEKRKIARRGTIYMYIYTGYRVNRALFTHFIFAPQLRKVKVPCCSHSSFFLAARDSERE